MSEVELEVGDRVRVTVSNTREGEEATVLYTFCEYGDHGVCVQFDDGEQLERAESSVEYIGPDKYEYAVQFHWMHYADDVWDDVSPVDWMSKENAERWLSNYEAANMVRVRDGKKLPAVGRLVKRRKAGKVEPV